MADYDRELIADIRASSRQLVRRWGALERHAAGTGLALSSVHAVLEIGFHDALTAARLGELLGLEKSSVSRMLKGLATKGLVVFSPDDQDGRQRLLSLSSNGWALFEAINAHADRQVIAALDVLEREDMAKVSRGLFLYAKALASSYVDIDRASLPPIDNGYRPGLAGQITDMHARFYHELVGFGPVFEATVAKGLADFVPRLDRSCNEIWHVSRAGRICASIAVDGEDLGDGIAHLRWFIIDGALRGCGLGKAMMSAAMDFCDRQGFGEVHLWTFSGLDAARHLYEQYGFTLVDEQAGNSWGTEVLEQKFVRVAKGQRAQHQ